MKVNRVESATLQAVVTLLKPACPDLDEVRLVQALKQFSGSAPASAPLAPVPGKALSPKQAAERYNCSRGTIFRLLREGKLPRLKLGARTVRIPEAAIARHMEQGAGRN